MLRTSLLLLSLALPVTVAAAPLSPIAEGVEYGTYEPSPGDVFHVVRVDPKRAQLVAKMSSVDGAGPRTLRTWCDDQRLLAGINLGMYMDDHRRNVGHATAHGHANQSRWNPQYQSVLVWDPKRPGLPAAAIVDRDSDGATARIGEYRNAVQNLRLIKHPGQNVWTEQPRKWSESAIASDGEGRILFIFAKRGHAMTEFNRLLLGLPLGVVAAMHVEGGPEASLCVRGGKAVDLWGSFETGFFPRDDNARQWEIPNVLGVIAKPSVPLKKSAPTK